MRRRRKRYKKPFNGNRPLYLFYALLCLIAFVLLNEYAINGIERACNCN